MKDRPARPTRVVRWHGPIDIVEVRDLLAEHTSFGGDFLGEVEIRCANKRCGIDVAILRISDIWAKRVRVILSLAKTSSDSLKSTVIRQSVHRPKTPSLVGGGATGIVRPSALHGHTGVAMEDGERAGSAAKVDPVTRVRW